MNVILDEIDKTGTFITLDRLRAQMSYGAEVSKQTVLCSLRFLEKHELITKEYRGPKPMIIKPTKRAYDLFRAEPAEL